MVSASGCWVENALVEGDDSLEKQLGISLQEVYERLEELDSDNAEARAAQLLAGLGFDVDMQGKPTKEYSGGWRMRIVLAQALFLKPDLLLLDEPTNHLDVHALTWLEVFLASWDRTVLIVSHDRWRDCFTSLLTSPRPLPDLSSTPP